MSKINNIHFILEIESVYGKKSDMWKYAQELIDFKFMIVKLINEGKLIGSVDEEGRRKPLG